jgi:hypothetical protein
VVIGEAGGRIDFDMAVSSNTRIVAVIGEAVSASFDS